MRRKTFDFRERLALIPLELVSAVKPMILVLLAFFLLSGLGGPGAYWSNAADYGLWMTAALIASVFAGAVLSPAFLPYLPGRAFSFKGFCLGILTAVVLIILRDPHLSSWPVRLESLSWLLLVPSLASYLAMSFTGASTYTSLSGVMKEMHLALPLQIVAAALGTVLFLAGRFIS
jgi:acetyl-CoA decarbonylase/synthase complex subunit gamma